jgi:hypothetical protein
MVFRVFVDFAGTKYNMINFKIIMIIMMMMMMILYDKN